MYEFKLADLGEGMHEAEVVEWLIKEGDSTRLDQTIAKVETDKAIVELPSPVAGRVNEIRIKDGQVARVGDVLVVFETSTPAADTTTTPNRAAAIEHAPNSVRPAGNRRRSRRLARREWPGEYEQASSRRKSCSQ